MRRQRTYLVNSRVRVPFHGYQRRPAATESYGAESESYPVSTFGPEHRLSPAEVWQAELLLARAERERGRLKGPRVAARIAGIVSAVRAGRVGDSSWGRHMAAKRGGQAMAAKHLDMLREMAPLAWHRSAEVRRLRKRREAYERNRCEAESSIVVRNW